MTTFGERYGRFCGSIKGLPRDLASRHDQPPRARLAYLRGDDVQVIVTEDIVRGLSSFAKAQNLRRLTPVHQTPGCESFTYVCCRCGKTGHAHEMLANLDGRPYHSYEHERCPDTKE